MNSYTENLHIPAIEQETLEEIERRMPQYLFYKPCGKKERIYQCTACHAKGIAVIPGKNGEEVECPSCHNKVTLKCGTRLSNDAPSIRAWVPVIYFKNMGRTLAAVGCRITRTFYRNSYDGQDWHPELEVENFEAYSFTPGYCNEWKKGYARVEGRWQYGWVRQKRPREPYPQGNGWGMNNTPDGYYVYQTEEIWKSNMKYCAVDFYIDDPVEDGSWTYNVMKYMTAYCERPKLELVCKWGLWDIAGDLVRYRKTNGHTVNWNGNTPWEFLKITRNEWNAYSGSTYGSVELLRCSRKLKVPVIPLLETCLQVDEQIDHWGQKAVELQARGIPLKEQVKYIQKAYDSYGGYRTFSGGLQYWIDYLSMAEKVGRDVSLTGAMMPRNLIDAHDEMVALERQLRDEIQAKELQQRNAAYETRRKKLEKKYGYRSHGLMIKVPESAGAIIREGNILKICVGGYTERHLTGKTTILFLRRERKPDTPYICIELDNKDRIVQIHGYKNENCGRAGKRPRNPREKFEPFLSEWLSWVKAGSKRTEKQIKEDATA